MAYGTKVNLQQIEAIRNSRIKTDYNQNILHKRTKQVRREISKLRKFASHKSGLVADNCNAIADQIELGLKA